MKIGLKGKYSIEDLKRGDKFNIYIRRGEGGNQMGPNIIDVEENLTCVVMGGLIGNTSVGNAYFMDGNPVGLPINSNDIISIEEGSGIEVIKQMMSSKALVHGGFHMKSYVDEFNEMPLKKGDQIHPSYDYPKQNTSIGVRNNHKVMNAGDLVFDNWIVGLPYISVRSVATNKTTFLAISSINLKRML